MCPMRQRSPDAMGGGKVPWGSDAGHATLNDEQLSTKGEDLYLGYHLDAKA